MSESTPAVFLSYASQDAEAAKKICDALRAAGIEVWFDQNELRGGDAWDQKIRRQIKECALFVPLITPNTNARPEGYFRLEWKLAVDRSHLMADDAPFLFPIVVGDVTDATARVPEKFRDVQWTRLRLDETPAELGRRIAQLLQNGTASAAHATTAPATASTARRGKSPGRWQWWMIFPIVGTVTGLLFALGPFWKAARRAESQPETRREPAPAKSEARRLADQAFALSVDKYDSTLDDFTTADALMKRALALDASDGEILARSAQLHFMFRNRGFDFSPERIVTGRAQAESAVRLAPESAEAYYAVSLAYRYTGTPGAAIAPLRRAIELNPQHTRALIWLGSRLLETGETQEGRALMERARQNPEWAPLVDYSDFLYHFATRQFAAADKFIRRSFAEKPSVNSAGGIAMLHLTWTGDLDTAARELSGVPVAMLNAPRLVWMTAQVHLNRRAPDEALRALDRLPDEFIRDSWFTGPKALLVGRAHALAGRPQAARLAWESALRFTDEALKKTPAEAAIHRARGELLAALGRADEALAEAKTFEELSRGAISGWNISAATIYATLGRADLAAPKLAAALQGESEGWPLTPTLLRQDPRWDPIRSDVQFQRLLIAHAAPRDWPQNPELKRVVTLLDRLDVIPEDFRLAEELTQRVLERNPTDAEATTAMARVHSMWLLRGWDRSTARYQKAKATAERALQLAPDEPEAHIALAIHLYARGAEPQRAVDLAQRAVDLCPQEPRFHRMRDNCLWVLSVPTGSVFLDMSQEKENEGIRRALDSARRTAELFPQEALVRYELSRHYRDIGRWADFERANDETLTLAPVANAMVWKARARFGLHGDLQGMKAVLDQVPSRVRGIERTVFGYFLYSAFSGRTTEGLDALNGLTEPWMIDFDFRGPKAMLAAALLELAGKKELARVQYESALETLQRSRAANPEDGQTFLNEAWIKHALGRTDEARTALRTYNETLARPFTVSPLSTWWFQAIPANLLMGERETALTLMREAVDAVSGGRNTIRQRLGLDPRLARFRDDAEIQAILAEPQPTK